jgi:hypothetical protein
LGSGQPATVSRPSLLARMPSSCAALVLAVAGLGVTACSVYDFDLLAGIDGDPSRDAQTDAALEAQTLVEAGDDALPDTADEPDADASIETKADAGVEASTSDVVDASTQKERDAEIDVVSEADVALASDAGSEGDAEGGVRVDAGIDAPAGIVLFTEGFEDGTPGMPATGWTRVGGSATDWEIADDAGRVFRQDRSLSTTLRISYGGPLVSGASSIAARVKVIANGTSAPPTAMLCIRYATSGAAFDCLGLEPGIGLQIKTVQGDGPIWATGISMNIWYGLGLAIDGSGLLSAYLDGSLLGTFRPSVALDNAPIAIGTLTAEAAFDDIVVTKP